MGENLQKTYKVPECKYRQEERLKVSMTFDCHLWDKGVRWELNWNQNGKVRLNWVVTCK